MYFLQQWFEAAKYALPLVGIAVIVLSVWMGPGRDFWRGFLLAMLLGAVVAGGAFYGKDTWGADRYFNPYEFFHYYLGAKYGPELGYTRLYEPALVAQHEFGAKPLPPKARSLVRGRLVPAATVLKNAEALKEPFSPARWKAFRSDVKFFHNLFRLRPGWAGMMADAGYNAPPTWTLVGGALANMVKTSSHWGMAGLALIDVAFMFAAALCVWWAFGARTMLLVALVMCTQYVTSHTHLKGSYMRLDWVMCLVMAACMLKKDRWVIAGMLLGWATCSRVFPAAFAFGIGAKLLLDLLIDRRLNRPCLRFLLAFAATVALVAMVSWLVFGTEYWREWITRISRHNDAMSAWRVSFKYVWSMSYRGREAALQDFNETIMWFRAIQLGVLLLCIPLARRLENYEALCFGIVPVFFVVAPTYYYYAMILVPALFFAAKVERWPYAVGLILIFLEGMGGHYGDRLWGRTFPQFFTVSVMVFAITIYIMLIATMKWRAIETTPPAAH